MSRATRVLVTGANGQVGLDLLDVLRGAIPPGGDPHFQPDGRPIAGDEFEVRGFGHGDLDVTDPDAVTRTLRSVRPDVVVHLAAYTAVDRAEDDADACYRVNDYGTELMSRGAGDVGAHLITVSTDYVFDGTKGSAYVEDDETRPLNVYGSSKRAGELRCQVGDTVVRTSWVMGVRGRNVVHTIADRASSGANVRFVDDQRGTVTAASDLARSLASLARERPGGVWHVADRGDTTWFDVAEYVGTLLGRGSDFAFPITTDELAGFSVARRPARSDLDTTKFASAFTSLPPWRRALERLVEGRATTGSS